MSHTPAPWIAKRGTEDEVERWAVYTDGPLNYHIATIENGAPGDTLETEGRNAHLIAAAPALLEALTFLLNETEDYIRINNLSAHHNHSLQMARAALAAAKGT